MDSFTQAASYLLSTWEFWKWFLSTSITVGSIFGAAYWAQGIFNRNALKREDRDRRLNALIEINEIIMGCQSSIVISSGKIDSLMLKYNDLNGQLIHMKSLNLLHELNIESGLDGFGKGLIEYRTTIDMLNRGYGISDDPLVLGEIRKSMVRVVTSHVLPAMDTIPEAVAKQFSKITKLKEREG